MWHEVNTEVLIVGAGPTGLLAALHLAQRGVRFRIIDQEEETASQSYACVLHPRSLAVLDQLGIAGKVVQAGYSINRIAFYSGSQRQFDLDLSELTHEFPFCLVLPQSTLEEILHQELHRRGVHIDWTHRLTQLRSETHSVVAEVDRFCRSAKGYAVPRMDWEVDARLRFRARFVIGADGSDSMVRKCSQIQFMHFVPAESFAIYELQCDHQLDHEARIILDETTSNVVWPMSPHQCRWTLQMKNGSASPDHAKDRSHWHLFNPSVEDNLLRTASGPILKLAPWFNPQIKSVDWSTVVQFERKIAAKYGCNQCWLVGDAAHQTSPIGMQSMNIGLVEANQLAEILTRILQENASTDLLPAYEKKFQQEWDKLLHGTIPVRAATTARPWIIRNAARILPCIPASGNELLDLIYQLDSSSATAPLA